MTHALEGDWYMVSRISSVLRRHRNSEETRKTKSFISPARLAFLSTKFCIGNRKKIWLLWFLSAKYHYDPGHIELGALPSDTPWIAVIWHLLNFAWDETWAGVSIPRGVPREACRWPCYLSHRIIPLLLRTKGGPGNRKHSKNNIIFQLLQTIQKVLRNLKFLAKIIGWPPYEKSNMAAIQVNPKRNKWKVMVRLLECNSKRMIHFKKVSVPPLMLPQWVTGLKKQINLEGAIAED